MADWHVDEVTDLKDTFKLQEVNEHPVDYESENVRIIILGYSYGLLDLFFLFFFMKKPSTSLALVFFSSLRN